MSDARGRILRAAAELIHDRGYASVSVSDICCSAGLKKGSFYHFFPSKLELVLETIDEFAAGQREAVRSMIAGPGNAREKLSQMFAAASGGSKQCEEECGAIRGCPIGNLALEMAHREPAIAVKLKLVFNQWRAGIESVLQAGVAAGEFELDDPRALAESLIAFVEGSILLAKATGDTSVFDRVSKGAEAILAGAVRTTAAS
ncbi:MAG: TetR/AcrR family transcriptional regulator [Nannocystaceae bacterium]|nr:TetR/AcrR family transcriptional regulator [Nannocystaceae bacterium]